MKIFRTFNEFMRHYFPMELKRQQEEEEKKHIIFKPIPTDNIEE